MKFASKKNEAKRFFEVGITFFEAPNFVFNEPNKRELCEKDFNWNPWESEKKKNLQGLSNFRSFSFIIKLISLRFYKTEN